MGKIADSYLLEAYWEIEDRVVHIFFYTMYHAWRHEVARREDGTVDARSLTDNAHYKYRLFAVKYAAQIDRERKMKNENSRTEF